jgi:hypothetical protein
MNSASFFLAQIDVKDSLLGDLHKAGSSRGGLTPLFFAVGIVTLLVLCWAIFIRKRPNESSRRYTYPSRDAKSKDARNGGESAGKGDRRRRRKRKRRSLNPTLAETGGLPPIRSEGYFEDPP